MTNSEKKIRFACILALITAVLCVPVFFLGSISGVHRAAANRLKSDIAEKRSEYNALTDEKSGVEQEIIYYNNQIEANSDMNVKMKEHEEKNASVAAEIEQEKAKSAELDTALAEARKASEQTRSTAAPTQQLSTIKADTYSCPNDIEAGSYTLSAAEGNIVIYGTNGQIRVSKSLSMLDGNEYTVQIKDGEKLKVDKDVSIRGTGRIKKTQPAPTENARR